MDFLKKLLGVAAGATRGATQPTRDNKITNDMVLRGLLPGAMRENRPQQAPSRTVRPQYEDERMVYGPRGPMPLNQINRGESWMNPNKALRYAEAGGVAEDSALGYTDRGYQPLNAMAPGENWEPMYRLLGR